MIHVSCLAAFSSIPWKKGPKPSVVKAAENKLSWLVAQTCDMMVAVKKWKMTAFVHIMNVSFSPLWTLAVIRNACPQTIAKLFGTATCGMPGNCRRIPSGPITNCSTTGYIFSPCSSICRCRSAETWFERIRGWPFFKPLGDRRPAPQRVRVDGEGSRPSNEYKTQHDGHKKKLSLIVKEFSRRILSLYKTQKRLKKLLSEKSFVWCWNAPPPRQLADGAHNSRPQL